MTGPKTGGRSAIFEVSEQSENRKTTCEGYRNHFPRLNKSQIGKQAGKVHSVLTTLYHE